MDKRRSDSEGYVGMRFHIEDKETFLYIILVKI